MAYSEAQKEATGRYKAKAYKRIPLDVKIEEYDELKSYCDLHNETINGFLRRIIKENIK